MGNRERKRNKRAFYRQRLRRKKRVAAKIADRMINGKPKEVSGDEYVRKEESKIYNTFFYDIWEREAEINEEVMSGRFA